MRALAALLFAVTSLGAQGKLVPLDEAGLPKMVAAHRGRVLLVDFWATWCVPCRAETPQLVKLAAKLRSRGFDLVTVSADEPGQEEAAFQYLKKEAASGPAYIKHAQDDDKFTSSVDAKWSGALPALFLFDRSGRKVRSFIGETPVKDLEAAIEKLL